MKKKRKIVIIVYQEGLYHISIPCPYNLALYFRTPALRFPFFFFCFLSIIRKFIFFHTLLLFFQANCFSPNKDCFKWCKFSNNSI